MIKRKSPADIAKLAIGGAILGKILAEVAEHTIVGATGKELDQLSQRLIAKHGTTPAFLNYAPGNQPPFPAALCVSINDGVVHGLPNDTPLKNGDMVKLDLGLVYEGLYLDSAHTVVVGPADPARKKLLEVTKESLKLGIAAAQMGKTTGDIGHAVQRYVEEHGFGVVRQLVGHGVGYAVHEEPQVPNFGKPGSGTVLREGLVIAIEPMVTAGDPEVTTGSDGWTVVTADGSLAAHEEHTIAITAQGPRILTLAV